LVQRDDSNTTARSSAAGGRRRQGVWWIATIPQHCFTPYLPPGVKYIRGQLEVGESETHFLHWQCCIAFNKKVSIRQFRNTFGVYHGEITRSEAALHYVWKEDTRVPGTQFELGTKPINRNSAQDWDAIWDFAIRGELLDIPADIRIRCYSTLRRIHEDFLRPMPRIPTCRVFWGPTGTGKSRRAWQEAGLDAYPKDPRTKFWIGYRDQKHVVIDEFRGDIDISHFLRWLDRYPVTIEIKGSGRSLCGENFWIPTNSHPRDWYPGLDQMTYEALLRRLEIIEMFEPFVFEEN